MEKQAKVRGYVFNPDKKYGIDLRPGISIRLERTRRFNFQPWNWQVYTIRGYMPTGNVPENDMKYKHFSQACHAFVKYLEHDNYDISKIYEM